MVSRDISGCMNKAQKVVVLVAVLIVAGMMLFPPWVKRYYGITFYRYIFMVTTGSAVLDVSRLAVQCAAVAVLAFGACVALSRRDGQ
jgi:hypothetical protein